MLESAHLTLKLVRDLYRQCEKLPRHEQAQRFYKLFGEVMPQIQSELVSAGPIPVSPQEASGEDVLLRMLEERADRRKSGKPVRKLHLLVSAA